jgi:hypothetical protein
MHYCIIINKIFIIDIGDHNQVLYGITYQKLMYIASIVDYMGQKNNKF